MTPIFKTNCICARPKNVRLDEATICADDHDIYVELAYIYDDENGTHKMIIPKIRTGLRSDDLPILYNHIEEIGNIPILEITYGYNACETFFKLEKEIVPEFKSNTKGEKVYIADKLIKPKEAKEMTLEEIEKKLGYKVKIVNKEKE